MTSIRKNLFYNIAYQLLLIAIPLITAPYLSRTLGANGIGVYSYNYSVTYYFSIFILLGLNNYGNRTIAMNRDETRNLSTTFCNIYALQLLLGILVFICYVGYIIFFASQKGIACIFIPFLISTILDINWFFWGIEKFRLTVMRNTCIKVLTTIFILILIKDTSDIYLYCGLMSLSFLISQLILWPYLKKEIFFVKPKWKNIKIHIKPNLILFLSVIGVSLYKTLDKIMLGNMSSMLHVGYYEQAEKIIAVPLSFIVSLGTVMLPRISNLYSKSRYLSNDIMQPSIYFSVFFSSSICFGIMGITEDFVPLFYGPGYDAIKPLFYILLPSCIFLGIGNVITTQYLIPAKKDKIYLKSIFVGAFLNILINLLLIPFFQSIGAAIGTLFAEMAVTLYKLYMCRKKTSILKFLKNTFPFIFSSIIMFFCIHNIQFDLGVLTINLIVKIFVGIFIYTITLGIQLLFCKELTASMKKIILH